jgi:hypothetical protein
MNTLRECPFCGGPASVIRDGGNEVWSQSWHVGCTKCSVQFKEWGSNSWNANKAEDLAAENRAIARWNRRPDDCYVVTPAGKAALRGES